MENNQVKKVVAPADILAGKDSKHPEPPPMAPEPGDIVANVPRFVKNMSPKGTITFKNGETWAMPANPYYCNNPVLAAKIREVASLYSICE